MGQLSIEAFYALADALTRPQRQQATGHVCLRNAAGDAFITVMYGRAIALDSPRRIARVRGPERITEDLLHYFEQGTPTHRFAPAADPPSSPPDAEPLALELVVHKLLRELPPERLAAAARHQRDWTARVVTPAEEIAFRLELPLRGLADWLAPAAQDGGVVSDLLDGESPIEETTAQLLVLLHATGHLSIFDPTAQQSRPRRSSGVAPSSERSPFPPRASQPRRSDRSLGSGAPYASGVPRSSGAPRGSVVPPSERSLGVREVRQKQADPERYRPNVQTKRRKIAPSERRRAVQQVQRKRSASPLPFNSARELESGDRASVPGLEPEDGLPVKTPLGGVEPAKSADTFLAQCIQDLDNNNFAGAFQAAEDAVALRNDHVVKLHLLWCTGMKDLLSAEKAVEKHKYKLEDLCRLSLLTAPGLAFAHYVRGEIARHAGKTDDAERCFKLALKYDPEFALPKRVLGAMEYDVA